MRVKGAPDARVVEDRLVGQVLPQQPFHETHLPQARAPSAGNAPSPSGFLARDDDVAKEQRLPRAPVQQDTYWTKGTLTLILDEILLIENEDRLNAVESPLNEKLEKIKAEEPINPNTSSRSSALLTRQERFQLDLNYTRWAARKSQCEDEIGAWKERKELRARNIELKEKLEEAQRVIVSDPESSIHATRRVMLTWQEGKDTKMTKRVRILLDDHQAFLKFERTLVGPGGCVDGAVDLQWDSVSNELVDIRRTMADEDLEFLADDQPISGEKNAKNPNIIESSTTLVVEKGIIWDEKFFDYVSGTGRIQRLKRDRSAREFVNDPERAGEYVHEKRPIWTLSYQVQNTITNTLETSEILLGAFEISEAVEMTRFLEQVPGYENIDVHVEWKLDKKSGEKSLFALQYNNNYREDGFALKQIDCDNYTSAVPKVLVGVKNDSASEVLSKNGRSPNDAEIAVDMSPGTEIPTLEEKEKEEVSQNARRRRRLELAGLFSDELPGHHEDEAPDEELWVTAKFNGVFDLRTEKDVIQPKWSKMSYRIWKRQEDPASPQAYSIQMQIHEQARVSEMLRRYGNMEKMALTPQEKQKTERLNEGRFRNELDETLCEIYRYVKLRVPRYENKNIIILDIQIPTELPEHVAPPYWQLPPK